MSHPNRRPSTLSCFLFFFRRHSSVHLACCPVFVVSFPLEISPPAISTRQRAFHMPSCFLFLFCRRGAFCTPPCFHSFIPPGGPSPGRSMRQHPFYMLPHYYFFSLMWWNLPLFYFISPLLLGDSFFSAAVSSAGDGVWSIYPLFLHLPPIYWGDFFL
jgi:hypothetical protein